MPLSIRESSDLNQLLLSFSYPHREHSTKVAIIFRSDLSIGKTDRSAGKLISEHDTVSPQQTSGIKLINTEKGRMNNPHGLTNQE